MKPTDFPTEDFHTEKNDMTLSNYISNDEFGCTYGRKDKSPNRLSRDELLIGLYHSDCVNLPTTISVFKTVHINNTPIEFSMPTSGHLDIDPPGASLNVTVDPDNGGMIDSFAIADSNGNVLFSDILDWEYDLSSINTMRIECDWRIE